MGLALALGTVRFRVITGGALGLAMVAMAAVLVAPWP
jgi:hypothetical protein